MDNIPQVEPVNPQPGFFAIIPASVRYHADLPPAAKLLFGEIVALTSIKGYCFAQNSYFSNLYSVDDRTIRRWLAALSQADFIRIEVDAGTNARRIFALAMLPGKPGTMGGQKSPLGGQKRPPGRTKTSAGADKNARQSITGINTEINTLLGERPGFVGPGPVAARDLKAAEEKVTASPSTVKSKSGSGGPSASKIRNVQRVIALTKDAAARKKLEELWDDLHTAGYPDVWAETVEKLKTMPGASDWLPERLSSAFVTFARLAADMEP